MKKDSVLKIMEYRNITPEDAMLLKEKLTDSVLTTINLLPTVEKLIDNAIKKETDDLTAFRLQFIKNKLTLIEDQLPDLGEDIEKIDLNEENEDRLKWVSEKGKEKIFKAQEYILKKEIEELVSEAVDFIFTTYPNLYLDNNRFLSSQAYKKYIKKIGVTEFFYLSDESAEKLRFVQNNLDSEIAKRIYDYEKGNLNEYLNEYLIWANENSISKHTKQNIVLFLKHSRKKLMNPIIDELKILVSKL